MVPFSTCSGHEHVDEQVKFTEFESTYWPRMRDADRKAVSALNAWVDIAAVIKGRAEAMRRPGGRLSRDEYKALPSAKCSVGATMDSRRDNVYDVLERYEKMKLAAGRYDKADVVFHVCHELITRASRYHGLRQLIHYVYVDEVQDLTPGQLLLFKFVCRNPRGFVFAGDTAQTIAHGVSFRFEGDCANNANVRMCDRVTDCVTV